MTRLIFFLFFLSSPLWAQINSAYDEQNPILSPDGMELYFTIAHHPANVSAKRDPGDIWVSKFLDGKWTSPVVVHGLINNGSYNAVIGFSSDGNEMFLYGHYNYSGAASGSQGISVSQRSSGGWSLPLNEEVPYFQNKSVATGGHINSAKTIFIFSADARGSHGNEDIYVSFNNGAKWTEPKNIGGGINTKNQELSPWLSDNTKSLYFASNSSTSIGSFDIYVSERLDDTWTAWSTPKSMGPSINSAGREIYYHTFKTNIFFTTTNNSDGYGDIREMASPTDLATRMRDDSADLVIGDTSKLRESLKPIRSNSTEQAQLPMKISGRVTNANTGEGIVAKIVFHKESVVSTESKVGGRYEIFVQPNVHHTVRIEAMGYIGLFEKIDLTNQSLSQVEINFKLQPVSVGVSINLRSVLFKQSSFELLPESGDELDMVVEFLKTNPTIEIELAGHTDNAGNAKLNLKLSRDRVDRVKNYITAQGIDGRRIKGVGYGGSKPIASNKTEEGKKLNRRVEFRILKE